MFSARDEVPVGRPSVIIDGEQKLPKVARRLPHIRQPERRDRDAGGAFKSYVFRQYLPDFFRYI